MRNGLLLAALVVMTACSGDGATPATTGLIETTADAATTPATVVATTEAAATTEPSTTTSTTTIPPTTNPPIAALTVTQIADIPERSLEVATSFDGATIVATGQIGGIDNTLHNAVMRFDASGAILGETPLDGSDGIGELLVAGGQPVAFGSFYDGDRFQCAFRSFDPDGLHLGPLVVVPAPGLAGSYCPGTIVADDVTPGVLWRVADDTYWTVHRADMAAGATEAIELTPDAAAGLPNDVDVFGGSAFVSMGHPQAIEQRAANLVRIDGTTRAITGPVPIGGDELITVAARLIVVAAGAVIAEVDPATLTVTPLSSVDFTLPPPTPVGYQPPAAPVVVSGDGVQWRVQVDQTTGALSAVQLDPVTGRVVGQGAVTTGVDPSIGGITAHPVAVGRDLYVFTSNGDLDDTATFHGATKLFVVVAA